MKRMAMKELLRSEGMAGKIELGGGKGTKEKRA